MNSDKSKILKADRSTEHRLGAKKIFGIVPSRCSALRFSALALAAVLLAGCKGITQPGERDARKQFSDVSKVYRPKNQPPTLPNLSTNSALNDFLAYAMLNQPRVEAAYYDWSASVERITVERSLPDPRITFESDIMEVIKTVMPGFMQEFPGPGKLRARANVATAESRAKYFAFESAVLQTAFDLKKSFYELHFLDERLRINHETLSLLGDLERIARAQNEVGKGTLQDVLRAQIEHDRVSTEIENLQDSREPMLANFKAALGFAPSQADPPVPQGGTGFQPFTDGQDAHPTMDDLLRTAFERNPKLKQMEAEVRMAEADINMAYKERVPDFSLGLMADAKASPTMFRPLAGMTLPIWRDKIAAEIAQAKANQLAAKARLNAEQIALTVEFAEKSFAYRELNRNLDLLQCQLIPKARQSLELARAGYLSGSIDFFNLIDTQKTLLDFELSEAEARSQREIVLAELSLMIAGLPPAGAPVLNAPQSNATH